MQFTELARIKYHNPGGSDQYLALINHVEDAARILIEYITISFSAVFVFCCDKLAVTLLEDSHFNHQKNPHHLSHLSTIWRLQFCIAH